MKRTLAMALLAATALCEPANALIPAYWVSIDPASTSWNTSQVILFAFERDQFTGKLTRWDIEIGGQSWSLSDFVPFFTAEPYYDRASNEVLFAGLNADNTAIFTGIALIEGGQYGSFRLGEIGAGLSGTVLSYGAGAGPLPEPGSWALLITGFGLTGAAMRRRRAAIASAREANRAGHCR